MKAAQLLESNLRRIAQICGGLAGALALAAGAGWMLGGWTFFTFGPDYVPTAPSTAFMMILLSVAAFLHALPFAATAGVIGDMP